MAHMPNRFYFEKDFIYFYEIESIIKFRGIQVCAFVYLQMNKLDIT